VQRQAIGKVMINIDTYADPSGDPGSALIDLLRHVGLMPVIAPDGRARLFHGSGGFAGHSKQEAYASRRWSTGS